MDDDQKQDDLTGKIVRFLRQRDFRFVKELGHGGCGRTVLLHDEAIDQYFVCKKYCPRNEAQKQVLFQNFVTEIKLLHGLYHPNVVRVFNYYLYPEELTGYIVMEYIQGEDIEDHLREHPQDASNAFVQVVEGFCHLEEQRILHRDVRPRNILVRSDGAVKVIDLGFGKKIDRPEDYGKSISLNWPFESPAEFEGGVYDFRTEVYFVGSLFETLLRRFAIDHFAHRDVLAKMCDRAHESRIPSFHHVRRALQSGLLTEMSFTVEQLSAYREFADDVQHSLASIETGAKYFDELDLLRTKLESAYQNCMLEVRVPDSRIVLSCIVNGFCRYYKKPTIRVQALRNFLYLLKSLPIERQRVLVANLHTRLDAVAHYSAQDNDFDPF